MLKLNLGCGNRVAQGYDNIDMYVDLPGIKKYDVCRLPYKNGSVDFILASHIIEHLGRHKWEPAVKEWIRVLKKGGKISIKFPEIDKLAKAIIHCPSETRWDRLNMILYGGQGHPGQFHYSGFKKEYFYKTLKKMGLRLKGEAPSGFSIVATFTKI